MKTESLPQTADHLSNKRHTSWIWQTDGRSTRTRPYLSRIRYFYGPHECHIRAPQAEKNCSFHCTDGELRHSQGDAGRLGQSKELKAALSSPRLACEPPDHPSSLLVSVERPVKLSLEIMTKYNPNAPIRQTHTPQAKQSSAG